MKLRVHVGNEFRAFHIRFRDVARGGIRIIRSRNKESREPESVGEGQRPTAADRDARIAATGATASAGSSGSAPARASGGTTSSAAVSVVISICRRELTSL